MNFVLTPHPKELSRLLNVPVDSIQQERQKYAIMASEKFDCTVVLKGFETIVVNNQNMYVNKTGNSTLAKAGTGDVLCGMIAGFIAQGCDLYDASLLSVYIHGLVGDEYAKENSPYSMLASDMLNYIPKILRKL